jgi:hypothetical protein
MTQHCEVYINIYINEMDKKRLVSHLNKIFENSANRVIYTEEVHNLDITDDAENLIIIDFDVDAQCTFIPGDPGSYWEPPTSPEVEDYLVKDDFIDWIKGFINPKDFDCEIEIDGDSYIPTEEELIKDYCEEMYYEEY